MNKTKEISRKEVSAMDLDYAEIMEKEAHHNHKLVMVNNVLRWEKCPKISALVDEIGLNDIVLFFYSIGIDKNHEVWRQLYRKIGYSLSGYWEIFYWEANNDEANLYNPHNNIQNSEVPDLEVKTCTCGIKFLTIGDGNPRHLGNNKRNSEDIDKDHLPHTTPFLEIIQKITDQKK